MENSDTQLKVITFKANEHNLEELAERLTTFKSAATRTPTPVTIEQLKAIDESPTNVLLLQIAETGDVSKIVGMVHLSIIYLEDRAHLGPICVDTEGTPRGHGTPLMEAAIEYVRSHFVGLRRLDLSNRPSHDHAQWYTKFGFVARTEKTGDPTTVYRLPLT